MALRMSAIVVAAVLASPTAARAEDLTVFAAASLKTALDAYARDWQAQTGNDVAISYGSSATLAKQIAQGAPADIYLSAATDWMDWLEERDLVVADSRRDFWGNSLVLIAHGTDAAPVVLSEGFDLAGLLAGGKLAMGMVDSVPAGQYGKQALSRLGLWPSVEAQVAQSENVRAALALVTQGEAPYGIVYASDAIADAGQDVSVVATFPAETHEPIVFPGAVVAASASLDARQFLDGLSSPAADAIFSAQGFTLID